jgi:uncharacterized protein (UPF0335 family)
LLILAGLDRAGIELVERVTDLKATLVNDIRDFIDDVSAAFSVVPRVNERGT